MSRNRQLENVEIIVADISTFEMEASYDRIFSIEMFEVKLSYFPQNMTEYEEMPKWICSCSLTAHEELQGSSEEDIRVDETGRPSVCPSFLSQSICLPL